MCIFENERDRVRSTCHTQMSAKTARPRLGARNLNLFSRVRVRSRDACFGAFASTANSHSRAQAQQEADTKTCAVRSGHVLLATPSDHHLMPLPFRNMSLDPNHENRRCCVVSVLLSITEA